MEEGFKFLGTLIEKGNYFLFLVGLSLLVVLCLEGLSIGGTSVAFSSIGITVLLPLSLLLTVLGLVGIVNAKRNQSIIQQEPTVEKPDELQQTHLVKLQRNIQNLNDKIHEIESLIINRTDDISTQIRKIIADLDDSLLDYQQETEDAILIAKWLNYKIEAWVAALKPSDYSEIKRKDIELFKDEIRQHLNLLHNNILEGTYAAPHLSGISRHSDYPFPYKKALKGIAERIEQGLDGVNELTIPQKDELLYFLKRLIEDIR